MSLTYVPIELRRLVAMRAGFICEYCLLHEDDTCFGCEIDHIISEKHGGSTVAENLAWTCSVCNRSKGSDIGSLDWETNQFTRFFNPRNDHWTDHFQLRDSTIEPLTSIGRVTVAILGCNAWERVLEREALIVAGRFPSAGATKRKSDEV